LNDAEAVEGSHKKLEMWTPSLNVGTATTTLLYQLTLPE